MIVLKRLLLDDFQTQFKPDGTIDHARSRAENLSKVSKNVTSGDLGEEALGPYGLLTFFTTTATAIVAYKNPELASKLAVFPMLSAGITLHSLAKMVMGAILAKKNERDAEWHADQLAAELGKNALTG
jgi:hypothetical protein